MLRKIIVILSVVGVAVVTLSIGYMLVKRSRTRLEELDSLDELREQFNQDRGKPRLVLLLSPT